MLIEWPITARSQRKANAFARLRRKLRKRQARVALTTLVMGAVATKVVALSAVAVLLVK